MTLTRQSRPCGSDTYINSIHWNGQVIASWFSGKLVYDPLFWSHKLTYEDTKMDDDALVEYLLSLEQEKVIN